MDKARWLKYLLLICAVPIAVPCYGATRAQYDCRASREFMGFGLNVWPLQGRWEPLSILLTELRVSWVRWKLIPDVEIADVPSNLSLDVLSNWLEGPAADGNQRSLYSGLEFFRRLRSKGIKQLAASWAVPRKWRARDPVGDGRGQLIDSSHIEDYARLLSAFMYVYKRNRTEPDALELLNEPPTKILPEQYGKLLALVRSFERSQGLADVHVAGPGAVFTWGNRQFLDEINRRGEQLDIVSTHVWDGNETGHLSSLSPLLGSIPISWKKPIFVTEYGADEDRWYKPPYGAGPRRAGPRRNAVDDLPFAAAAAAETMILLAGGANAVIYWQAQDPPWEKDKAWGLLDTEDRARPAVGALKTVLAPLQVGDRLLTMPEPPTEPVPVLVAQRGGQLVVEIANPEAEDRQFAIGLEHCGDGSLAVAHSEAWPADRQVAVQATQDGGVTATLPANTVVAITLSRGG